jgi:hypothetical protein
LFAIATSSARFPACFFTDLRRLSLRFTNAVFAMDGF